MENFNKWFCGIFMAFTAIAMASYYSPASASVGVRSPKKSYVLSFSSSAVITPSISSNAIVTSAEMSGAVYQVLLGTAASLDYCVLLDTSSLTGGVNVNSASLAITPRMYFSSATQNTLITFDPPIVFFQGLTIQCSSAFDQSEITYELGRGLSGQ